MMSVKADNCIFSALTYFQKQQYIVGWYSYLRSVVDSNSI